MLFTPCSNFSPKLQRKQFKAIDLSGEKVLGVGFSPLSSLSPHTSPSPSLPIKIAICK